MVNIKMLAKVCEMDGKKEGAFDRKNLKKELAKMVTVGKKKR